MNPLLPAHYALSEGVLFMVTALAVWRLARVNWIVALGLAPFGLAGLAGTVRIAAGLSGMAPHVHRFLSQSGALFGLCCLVGAGLARPAWRHAAVGLGVTAIAMPILAPQASQILFIALVLIGSVVAANRPAGGAVAAAGFALLLGAQMLNLALRPFHPDLAWHFFHLLVAYWVMIVAARFLELRSDPA